MTRPLGYDRAGMADHLQPRFIGGPLDGKRGYPNGQRSHRTAWERPNPYCPTEKRRAVYAYDAGEDAYRFMKWEESPLCFKCAEKRRLGMVTR